MGHQYLSSCRALPQPAAHLRHVHHLPGQFDASLSALSRESVFKKVWKNVNLAEKDSGTSEKVPVAYFNQMCHMQD